jgi:hypothetical protein
MYEREKSRSAKNLGARKIKERGSAKAQNLRPKKERESASAKSSAKERDAYKKPRAQLCKLCAKGFKIKAKCLQDVLTFFLWRTGLWTK